LNLWWSPETEGGRLGGLGRSLENDWARLGGLDLNLSEVVSDSESGVTGGLLAAFKRLSCPVVSVDGVRGVMAGVLVPEPNMRLKAAAPVSLAAAAAPREGRRTGGAALGVAVLALSGTGEEAPEARTEGENAPLVTSEARRACMLAGVFHPEGCGDGSAMRPLEVAVAVAVAVGVRDDDTNSSSSPMVVAKNTTLAPSGTCPRSL
jgi:hypothetical protein